MDVRSGANMGSRAKRRWWTLVAVLAAWLSAVIGLDGIDQIKTAAGIAVMVFTGTLLFLFLIGFGLAIAFVVSIALLVAYSERRRRRKMDAAGRFIDWPELEAKLERGEGTLIAETWYASVEYWWTSDDLIGAAPQELPDSLASEGTPADAPLAEYAKVCVSRYIEADSGTAKLTQLPVTLLQRLTLRVPNKLPREYPAARIVTLAFRAERPMLAIGDASTTGSNPRLQDG